MWLDVQRLAAAHSPALHGAGAAVHWMNSDGAPKDTAAREAIHQHLVAEGTCLPYTSLWGPQAQGEDGRPIMFRWVEVPELHLHSSALPLLLVGL